MKNRVVGFLVIAIAILLGFIIFSFNVALSDIVSSSCSHGEECPMWGSIEFQTNVSIGIMAFVMLIGFYLIFFSKEEKIITRIRKVRDQIEPKKLTKKSYKKILNSLSKEEKAVFKIIIESNGSVFQSDIVKQTKLNKVKVTRTIDKLEGRGLVERKRRGMRNIIILKH